MKKQRRYERLEKPQSPKSARRVGMLRAEKRTVPGSSNLNLSFSGAQQKFFAREMKEKGVRFCFLKLKGKISPKSSRAG